MVVVVVTLTTAVDEVGAREGVDQTWVNVVPVLVLGAITSTGLSRDGVGEVVPAPAGVADAAGIVEVA